MVVHNLFKKLNNLSINVQDRNALHYEPLRNLITGKHFSSTGKILSNFVNGYFGFFCFSSFSRQLKYVMSEYPKITKNIFNSQF